MTAMITMMTTITTVSKTYFFIGEFWLKFGVGDCLILPPDSCLRKL